MDEQEPIYNGSRVLRGKNFERYFMISIPCFAIMIFFISMSRKGYINGVKYDDPSASVHILLALQY